MPQTSYFPLSIGDGADSRAVEITITAISAFGEIDFEATSLQHTMNPRGHDPGGMHTISVSLISQLAGNSQQKLEALIGQEDRFMKVDWGFDLPYPKLTTRHLMVMEPTPLISFSGGLDWALKIRKSMASLNMAAPPIRSMSLPVPPRFNTREPQKQPFSSNRAATWNRPSSFNWLATGTGHIPFPFPGPSNTPSSLPGSRTDVFPPPGLLDTPRCVTPALSLDDDQSSVSSGITSPGGTISDAAFGSSYFSPLSTRQNSSRVDEFSNQWMDKLAEQQLLDEQFQQQKREAEALYARTGDVSGLRAVLALASKSSSSADGSLRDSSQPT